MPPSAFAARPDVYEPLLRALVETGTGLEVNASGLRQGPRETYPPPWAVARFRELGGTVVTAGSDAHAASHFAFGLARAYEIARGGRLRGAGDPAGSVGAACGGPGPDPGRLRAAGRGAAVGAGAAGPTRHPNAMTAPSL